MSLSTRPSFGPLLTRSVGVFVFLLTFAAGMLTAADSDRTMRWYSPSTITGRAGDTIMVTLKAKIGKGSHTYGNELVQAEDGGPQRTEFTFEPKNILKQAGKVKATRGAHAFYDTVWKAKVEEWEGSVEITIPVRLDPSLKIGTGKAKLNIYYQVCDAIGCAPPTDTTLAIDYSITAEALVPASPEPDTTASSGNTTVAAPTKKTDNVAADATEEDEVSREKGKGLMSFFLYAMGVGFLALLTPCVFPMIPITVSFFTKRHEKKRSTGLRDSAVFGIGIISTFTALGLLVSAITGGTGVQDLAASPSMNIALALVFLVLAFNLFGAFEIQVPVSILNKLNMKSQGNSLSAVWLMGLTFALTSFTCTVPFVGTLLLSASKGQDSAYAVVGTLGFATAFALPFFILSLFPALLVRLPRAGGWMNNLKVVMGFIEIAAALKFISSADLVAAWGIMPREVFLAIWAGVCILTSLYILGVFTMTLDSKVDRVGGLRAVFATIFMSMAVWFVVGASGRTLSSFVEALIPPDNYHELIDKANGQPQSASTVSLSGADKKNEKSHEIWLDDLETAKRIAREQNKPILIDFTGFSCHNCRLMEKYVFTKPVVQKQFEKFVLVQLYTDRKTEPYISNQNILKTFGTVANPLYVILRPDGSFIAKSGYLPQYESDPGTFVQFLGKAL